MANTSIRNINVRNLESRFDLQETRVKGDVVSPSSEADSAIVMLSVLNITSAALIMWGTVVKVSPVL